MSELSPIATLDERDFLGLAGVLRLHLKRCGSLESTGEHDTLLRAADALESFANPSTIQAAGWIPGDEQALEADRAMTKALAYSDCISACEAVIADYSAHKNADGLCTGPDFNFGEIEAVGRAIERIRSEAQMRTPSATSFTWIPVAERLPDDGDDVLFVTGRNPAYVWIGWRSVEDNAWFDHFDDGKISANEDVTHWMPLPEVPNVAR